MAMHDKEETKIFSANHSPNNNNMEKSQINPTPGVIDIFFGT